MKPRRSPAAAALRQGQYQPKRIKSAKAYTRKQKHRR